MGQERIIYGRLNPSERTLFGADLSNASPRARQRLMAMLQGAGDPEFLAVVELARELMRSLWRTESADLFLVPGTEEAGLETVLANLVQPEDTVCVGIVGANGYALSDMLELTTPSAGPKRRCAVRLLCSTRDGV